VTNNKRRSASRAAAPDPLPGTSGPARRFVRRSFALAGIALLVAQILLTGCSASGSGGARPTPSASDPGCVGKPGDQLVVLTDDRKAQNSENLVPLVRTTVAKPPLTTALNAVSKALTQDELQGLNRAVSVDRTGAAPAAQDFIARLKIGNGLSGGHGTIVVAAADFSESVALANVYAAVLTKAGFDTSVKELTSREMLEPALESGAVQVTPEYAATLTTFLAGKEKQPDVRASNEIGQTMAALRPLAERRGLTVLDPSVATNQNAFAVTKETADSLGVKTLSDLAAKCAGGVTFGGPPECPQRPFCQPALEKTYSLKITQFSALDADGPLTRQALKQGRVTLAEVFSSDADVVSAAG
jgi:osmoprotectant transport system substrate-binding protein